MSRNASCKTALLNEATISKRFHGEKTTPATVYLLCGNFDQFEAERGGDGLQVGKLDVFALLDVADGGLIGNASSFC